jgi:3-hydroxyisobutyrate dehydrogenase
MAKLGFVGLGMMGSRIVKRLLEAGHQVSGYNRMRAKAKTLIQAGMQWKDSPAKLRKPPTSPSAW